MNEKEWNEWRKKLSIAMKKKWKERKEEKEDESEG